MHLKHQAYFHPVHAACTIAALLLAVVLPGADISTKPLLLKTGGTLEKPAVFDGKGMVIDLGTDVTDEAWKKDGDVWTSTGPLLRRQPLAPGQFTGLFVEGIPITIARDRAAEKARTVKSNAFAYLPPAALLPGQMGCLDDGSIYFRWPKNKLPGKHRVILPSKAGTSCVTIACSHIIVKNITAMHASNDGFNIHGSWVGIRLENIRALSNADEGISAHDDVQMDVEGAEIAWNGSFDGGVADVNRSQTTYKNCQSHDNVGAAFKFFGKSHSVSNILIFNQARDFYLGETTVFKQEGIKREKP